MQSNPGNLPYTTDYYVERDNRTTHSAQRILSELLLVFPVIRSAVDFGCGVGTWLHNLDLLTPLTAKRGFDGAWVDQKHLVIPLHDFEIINFEDSLRLQTKYDLAMSLEVAEHLSESCSSAFIDNLTSAADLVLFSAAVPKQAGRGHVNEQWPSYWAEKFSTRGFECYDFLRARIWTDDKIPYWYRQNVMVYVRKSRADLKPQNLSPVVPLSLIHPDMFTTRLSALEDKIKKLSTVRGCVRQLYRSFTAALPAYRN